VHRHQDDRAVRRSPGGSKLVGLRAGDAPERDEGVPRLHFQPVEELRRRGAAISDRAAASSGAIVPCAGRGEGAMVGWRCNCGRHVKQIFQELDLPASPDSHRRVLAVLTHLRAA
jgi:hypothetical protein